MKTENISDVSADKVEMGREATASTAYFMKNDKVIENEQLENKKTIKY